MRGGDLAGDARDGARGLRTSADVSVSEGKGLVHPVVAAQDLLAVEARELLGAGLGDPDQALRPDRAPALPELVGVALQEVVLCACEHLCDARISLPGSAAEELAIDAPAAVRLGCDDVEPAILRDAAPEMDVGAAAGHVRRDGNSARLPRLGDDLRLLAVLPRVEDAVREVARREAAIHFLARPDAARADQNGHALAV